MSENTNTASNSSAEKKQKTPFFKGVKAEFKKIVWPDKQTLFRQTVAVVVVSFITGLLIAVIDRLLQYGINFMIG
ncbi:MAG: preprotein translocase subunit SecE [Lachnospiraceae bacterium]|nr:preprotein translocase subunit SecE [Lachnospiraceae bacterium]